MTGKLIAIFFAAIVLVAGGGMYYLQVYHYYRTVDQAPATLAVQGADGAVIDLPVADYQGIYSVSSPLANRACFTTDPALAATAAPYPAPTPLIPPRWFDCFDVAALTDDIAAGRATAWLVQKNIAPKIDAVLAVYPDGRAYEWRQTNEDAEEKRTID
ncbi:DUF6446 family protein [Paracoccus sp. DMF-8]|uniref:DUF6446 family protein n=1 Tax=Paracoccus sp. DMF-8 TaxID=3019445 RepID=UPI0023E36988|nr:DUF6446 family protein [Paracoccus sp. DMF-8]MDF3607795.1 DUF6446 family protein [Paracoccus sp. DMF-8]